MTSDSWERDKFMTMWQKKPHRVGVPNDRQQAHNSILALARSRTTRTNQRKVVLFSLDKLVGSHVPACIFITTFPIYVAGALASATAKRTKPEHCDEEIILNPFECLFAQ